MVHLQKVQKEDRELLWNINQKFLYEMTLYYPDVMDEAGNYHYGNFDAYFSDSNRSAFFIRNDETLIGFVMLNPYSVIGHNPDNTIAKFTIFPSYRRHHYALQAAQLIISTYPGKWEIKYNEQNTGAKKLWHKVTAPYRTNIYHINDTETVLEFTNQ